MYDKAAGARRTEARLKAAALKRCKKCHELLGYELVHRTYHPQCVSSKNRKRALSERPARERPCVKCGVIMHLSPCQSRAQYCVPCAVEINRIKMREHQRTHRAQRDAGEVKHRAVGYTVRDSRRDNGEAAQLYAVPLPPCGARCGNCYGIPWRRAPGGCVGCGAPYQDEEMPGAVECAIWCRR